MQQKKIIVTGAAGLVGQNLVQMLVKSEFFVVALDKNEHNLSLLKKINPNVKCVVADCSQQGTWMQLFKDSFAVVQLQAQIAAPSRELFERNNISSVNFVLAACKQYRIKHLVHLSSSVVISVATDDYTTTKRLGEIEVRRSGVSHTIFRPPLMYGCFDAKHLGWLTKFMEKSPVFPIPGMGTFVRQPLYVQDMCRIILSAIRIGPKNRIHNVIGHERIPYIAMMKILAKERGLHRVFIRFPPWLFGALLNTFNKLTGKAVFTTDQLSALIAGDEFPIEPWTKEFGVMYTPFHVAVREMFADPRYKYRDEMISPH